MLVLTNQPMKNQSFNLLFYEIITNEIRILIPSMKPFVQLRFIYSTNCRLVSLAKPLGAGRYAFNHQ